MLRDFFLGSIKIHILYHADVEPIYGAFLMEELASHGYNISPGTLYPTLKSLHENGLLHKYEETVNGKVRKYYTITKEGKRVLEEGKQQVRELAQEVLHDDWNRRNDT
ncbi:PadR family transcriptional regulator [Halobacillus andaensis]|uniref:PadR family transcriptional regulator n=1 Tax=Halobacillus andaensis TaxID=1176239 RepID=A0A917BAS4_HALAA|nr:PadR family transcriptional regulator [Halobacillus andaensis]MBP2006336.1 DNA-binding PadR family transcriptional regulator [Halobacillus andaensis]GGF34344.1 PadR family transcriptional regulator [Halobacillus andaensis]